MRVIKIWVADERICRDKLNYVLTNINIHNFCQNHFNFITTTELSEADLVYGSVEKITSTNVALKMKASAHLLVKELIPLNFTVKNVRVNGKTLHFIKKTTEVESENPEKILPDLFETLFFHWSRYEEVIFPVEKRDQWDLMPEKELLVVKNQLYHTPFLDDLILWLINMFIPDFTPVKILKILNTWDIDYLHFDELSFKENIGNLFSILKRSKNHIKGIIKYLEYLSQPKIDFNNLFLKKEGIIFILIGGSHLYDFAKSKRSYERIRSLIQFAKNYNFEIGVHPSFETTYNFEKLHQEISLLENFSNLKVTKSRQHFLHIDYINTIPLLEQIGIKEDYSNGFNTYTGYKIGSSFCYHYWNWKDNRSSSVTCLPLIWMDSAQWYQSEKLYANYKIDKDSFFRKQDYGMQCINEHPIFKKKLESFE